MDVEREVMVYYKAISRYLRQKTQKNCEKPQSGYVCGPRFEPRTPILISRRASNKKAAVRVKLFCNCVLGLAR